MRARRPGAVFLQPGLEVIEYRLRQLLTLLGLFCRRQILDAFLDGIELADLANGRVRLANLCVFLYSLARLCRLRRTCAGQGPSSRCG